MNIYVFHYSTAYILNGLEIYNWSLNILYSLFIYDGALKLLAIEILDKKNSYPSKIDLEISLENTHSVLKINVL
jgi:hypothetical protein